MKIEPIPSLQDNYAYLVIDEKAKEISVVDPVEPAKVVEAISKYNLPVKSILTTHHHYDHAGGNKAFTELFPGITVYGGDNRIPALTRLLKDGEEFDLGSLKVRSLKTNGHTSSSISYFIQDGDDRVLFSGDTLFIAGCGRLFEGTPADMHESLNVKFASLPKDTKVYVGHEYTASNVRFAMSVDGDNEALKAMQKLYSTQKMTIPSTIQNELNINPFMRVNEPALQKATGETDPVSVLAALRKMKDSF